MFCLLIPLTDLSFNMPPVWNCAQKFYQFMFCLLQTLISCFRWGQVLALDKDTADVLATVPITYKKNHRETEALWDSISVGSCALESDSDCVYLIKETEKGAQLLRFRGEWLIVFPQSQFRMDSRTVVWFLWRPSWCYEGYPTTTARNVNHTQWWDSTMSVVLQNFSMAYQNFQHNFFKSCIWEHSNYLLKKVLRMSKYDLSANWCWFGRWNTS